MSFADLDSVMLVVDLPEFKLKAGARGVIVDVTNPEKGIYLVEFFEGDQPLDSIFVHSSQLRASVPKAFSNE